MRTADIIAGPTAGFAVCLAFYPFDTLKTRVQSPAFRKLAAEAAHPRKMWLRGLYQGIGPIILATMPGSAVFFTSYESSKRFLLTSAPQIPEPITHVFASSLAEVLGCVVATPAEVIKQNAQVLHETKGSSSLAALELIGRNPKDLWRGFTLLAGRNLPFVVIQFPLYERLKVAFGLRERGNGLMETAKVTGTAAGLSGGVAAWLTTPVDMVKTIIMLGASKRGGKRLRAADVAKSVWREEGVKGLWRGGALRGIWTAAGSGLYLGIYECILLAMGEKQCCL
ncbi:mitochondrial carrier [Choiromyces venosus 120613-1]|uniref:Mitochondrial carrier n=1 Tax=Choiromyces venosus 120613-1 TaxID=1336337 RepID=A0A3N4JK71_9PEZI|nr:mitochondrial carrier [Choiromyces venosus 120613-1]